MQRIKILQDVWVLEDGVHSVLYRAGETKGLKDAYLCQGLIDKGCAARIVEPEERKDDATSEQLPIVHKPRSGNNSAKRNDK